jgi:hypothetical protein
MNTQLAVSVSTASYGEASVRQVYVPADPQHGLSSDLTTDAMIEQALYALVPHSLDSLKNAELMSRVDSKFLLPVSLAADLLTSMGDSYTVLEINGRRSFNYVTTYYDTALNTHYLAHHNGRLNRFKIRRRTYVESHSSFLEVKFKDNHRRTTKTRMSCDTQRLGLDDEAHNFLMSCRVPAPEALEPVQTGVYQRVALANEAKGERLTIDFQLSFTDERDGAHHALGPWAIVEVKQDLMNRDSAFFAWAKRHGVRELSFSKYCMGAYFTGAEGLKRNNFHPIARRLRI